MSRDYDYAVALSDDELDLVRSYHSRHNGDTPYCEFCRLLATLEEAQRRFDSIKDAKALAETVEDLEAVKAQKQRLEDEFARYKRDVPQPVNYRERYGMRIGMRI